MARHGTHKTGAQGKARTIAMRKARAAKHGKTTTNRNGR